jgi:hypothetical protein
MVAPTRASVKFKITKKAGTINLEKKVGIHAEAAARKVEQI